MWKVLIFGTVLTALAMVGILFAVQVSRQNQAILKHQDVMMRNQVQLLEDAKSDRAQLHQDMQEILKRVQSEP